MQGFLSKALSITFVCFSAINLTICFGNIFQNSVLGGHNQMYYNWLLCNIKDLKGHSVQGKCNRLEARSTTYGRLRTELPKESNLTPRARKEE